MSDKPRLALDADASKELEALLDDVHGKDRPTVGNGMYKNPWTHTTEGDEAGDEPCLHVTVEGDVWLNPTRTKFDGLCIGAGDSPIDDAVETLETALRLLYAYRKRGL